MSAELTWYVARLTREGWKVTAVLPDGVQLERPTTAPPWIGAILALVFVAAGLAWLTVPGYALPLFALGWAGVAILIADRLTRRPELRFVTGLDARTARQQEPT